MDEKKLAKKAYKKARGKATKPWKFMTWLSGVLAVLLTIVTVVVFMFDNTVTLFVQGSFWELENEDENAVYFKGDFETEEERIAHGKEIVKQVEAEGAVLLTNENAALPLAKGAKVSLMSNSSVNFVFGGVGSGNVDASKADNLRTALEKQGFKVNATLWDYYLSDEGQEYVRDSGSFTSAAHVNETPWGAYPEEVLTSLEEYNDAVIVTLSRIGGEGLDLEFSSYNYLELDKTEKEMLTNLKALKDAGKIDKIVVLLNSSNPIQMDFLQDNPYGIDATLWVAGVGVTGLNAIAEILDGTVNPSGSLVDTYCYDNYSSPAMQNFVPVQYEGYEEGLIPEHADTYMIYQEGIYVGYKYYETRYEDYVLEKGNAGNYAYGEDVAFPFGYGLSYTEFEYSDMQLVYDKETTTYNISVTVTNKGSVAGKETVQIYVSSPYTQYDIDKKVEKASVSLVGFDKTQILQPGESEVVNIPVDGDYVASYDAYGYGTYILDAGDYYFTAATDAHDAANNVLAAKGYTPESTEGRMDEVGNVALVCTWNNPALDYTTHATSDAGVKIKNQLSASDPNLNEGVEQEVTFLTRNDWEGTMPNAKETVKIVLNDYLVKKLQDVQYDASEYEPVEMPTLGVEKDIDLYDMIGLDYDDPKWDDLLNQLTYEEMVDFLGDAFHWHMPLTSINAPGTRDENGPQGLTVSLFGANLGVDAIALTSEDVLAATFNTDLIEEVGKVVGNDCLAARVTFLYGPGANMHRTPYGGRNFEYYSEDAFLSSEAGKAEIKGIEKYGVYVVMKHFALNDCEQDRIGLGVWLTEQAAREIYLRGFQGALEDSQGSGNGVMMAYTRWGTQWSGAVSGLVRGIMNEEWNCNGLQITDNVLTTYTTGVDGIMGGTTTFDAMMYFYITGEDGLRGYEDDAVVVSAVKEACHHNLYAIANSQAMNGIGPDTVVKEYEPVILTTCRNVTIAVWIVFAVSLVLWITKRNKFKQTEEYKKYQELKATNN